MRYLKALFIVFVFLFCLLFLVQNNEVLGQPLSLTLNLFYVGLNWEAKEFAPLYFIVIVAFALGALFMWVLTLMSKYQSIRSSAEKNKQIRELNCKIKDLEAAASAKASDAKTIDAKAVPASHSLFHKKTEDKTPAKQDTALTTAGKA